jgi:lipopolysaccharide transport system ATP-binding protein
MGSLAIRVENVSKKYRIGSLLNYYTLRDQLTEGIRHIFRQNRVHGSENDIIWALRDVSFEIERGEVMGIIGRNGSGKSTLLKILSRITEPTEGSAEIHGRIASLLEVGTGFHPELTGRENIYLNGAILGMKRFEINRKFDEIVEFSEIGRFIDTPVKHYSSGMYVRLAFAVAAHLEPEILLVDEVLAVGDARFQKKCLGKMEEVGQEGRTILLVSHSTAMITSLCSTCLFLHEGGVAAIGPATAVVQQYYADGATTLGEAAPNEAKRIPGDDVTHFLGARLTDERGNVITEVQISEPIIFEMDYEVHVRDAHLTPNFHVYGPGGGCIFVTSDAVIDPDGILKGEPGAYRARCKIPGNFLNDGIYYVGFAVSTMEKTKVHFFERDLLQFVVIDPIEGNITRGKYAGPMPGAVRPLLKWESERMR